MTRKRFVKMLMANGMSRRQANKEAESARKAYGFESYEVEYLKRTPPIKNILCRMQKEFEEAYGLATYIVQVPQKFEVPEICLKPESMGVILGDAEDARKRIREEIEKHLG